MLVYLGGPIDLAGNIDYRKKIKEELRGHGINSFDPKGAFDIADIENSRDMRALIDINKVAMLNCSASIFVVDPSVLSVGTSIEIYMAYENQHSMVIIWLSEDKPVPAYIRGHTTNIISTDYIDDKALIAIVNKLKELYKDKTKPTS